MTQRIDTLSYALGDRTSGAEIQSARLTEFAAVLDLMQHSPARVGQLAVS